MAATLALVLAVLAAQIGPKPGKPISMTTEERMQQHEEYLHNNTTQQPQENEHSRAAEEALPLSVVSQQLLSSTPGVLVLIVEVCCLAWKLMRNSDGLGNEENSDEKEEDLDGAHDGVTALDVLTPLPVQALPETCKVVKELVGDLLGICRVLCKKSFMPQMYPALETDGTWSEAWNVHENNITYRLQVLLRPPSGHSFCLEPDTTGQPPERHSIFRVVPECMCLREEQLGDVFCFLHHTEDELPRTAWSLYRLHTLCTGSYLDVEKVICWVQLLMRSAWLLLPQSHYCQLTVLPSSHSLRFQLTSTSKMNIYTEMMFAV